MLTYTHSKSISATVPLSCLPAAEQIRLCQDLLFSLLCTDALNEELHGKLCNYVAECLDRSRG